MTKLGEVKIQTLLLLPVSDMLSDSKGTITDRF